VQTERLLRQQAASRVDHIHGELFPPAFINQLASQLLSYTFFIGLFLLFAGEWFFTSVVVSGSGVQFVRKLKDNQVWTLVGLMVCNLLSTSLLSTGAFEVYFDGQLIHSKLATGHAPNPNFILDRLKEF